MLIAICVCFAVCLSAISSILLFVFFQLEGILFYFYGGAKEEERLRGMAVNGCERVVLDQCTFFRYVRKPYKHVLDMIQKQQLAHAHVLDQHSGVHHVIQWLAEPHLVT